MRYEEAETPTGTVVIYENGDVVSPKPYSRGVKGWAYLAGDATLIVSWESESLRFIGVAPEFVLGMMLTPSLQKFVTGAVMSCHEGENWLNAVLTD